MNSSNEVAQVNIAGRAAWVCLVIAWVAFLVPFPGLGLFVGWPLNLVAFILAIVAMSKMGAGAGLWQLLASLLASPVVYFIGWAVLFGMVGAGHSHSTSGSVAQSSAPRASAAALVTQPQASASSALPIAPPQVGSQWEYRQDKDPMGKGTAYFASVLSTNTVNFGFPYSGAQHGTLTLRTHPRYGKDVILSIERGQFLCPSYDGCTVLVRFDDNKAIRYSAASAADNSTETIFIRGYASFVGHLEKSKRVRISANVYQEGAPVFEFDVTGFDPSKYKPGKEQ